MPSDARVERHFWLPIPSADGNGGTRHAFRGARWLGTSVETAVCGSETPMAEPSEMDWILHPTCQPCYDTLKSELA